MKYLLTDEFALFIFAICVLQFISIALDNNWIQEIVMTVNEQVNHLNELVLLIDEKSELNTKQIQVLSDLFKLVHESIKIIEERFNEV